MMGNYGYRDTFRMLQLLQQELCERASI